MDVHCPMCCLEQPVMVSCHQRIPHVIWAVFCECTALQTCKVCLLVHNWIEKGARDIASRVGQYPRDRGQSGHL